MQLRNKSKNINYSFKVEKANSFYTRLMGLMGRKTLDEGTTLWITKCRSVHTFFMKFPIDVVFVDGSLVVKKIIKNISPWRLPMPALSAQSVFEFKTGGADRLEIEEGDQLDVVH